ncbi:MAG: transposase, partial [Bryobacteraceae bacterium]
VVRSTGARYRWNMISAVNGRGDLRFMLTAKAVTAQVFVEFLRRLMTGAQRPVSLIVEGHASHRSPVVRQFLRQQEGRIRLLCLPPQRPELNPDEQAWRKGKAHGGGRRALARRGKVKQHHQRDSRQLQRVPPKIRAFFRAPETAYARAA